jgi:hypothetical protein
MKLPHLSLLLVSAVAMQVFARPALAANDFFVFKASLTLPVTMVVIGPQNDVVVTRKITSNDLVNLALGRALGSKVNSKTEILALAGTFESPSNAPFSKLIVFDPSQNGVLQKVTTVVSLTALDYASAFGNTIRGTGIATGVVETTTLGVPAQNGLLPSTLVAAATGSGPFQGGMAPLSVSGKGIVTGKLKFTFTVNGITSTFDGFVTAGKIKVSGKRLGIFTE